MRKGGNSYKLITKSAKGEMSNNKSKALLVKMKEKYKSINLHILFKIRARSLRLVLQNKK